ncbi:MAG: hypothetical protein ACR2NA_00745 [Solirubrobacterales bacterium]
MTRLLCRTGSVPVASGFSPVSAVRSNIDGQTVDVVFANLGDDPLDVVGRASCQPQESGVGPGGADSSDGRHRHDLAFRMRDSAETIEAGDHKLEVRCPSGTIPVGGGVQGAGSVLVGDSTDLDERTYSAVVVAADQKRVVVSARCLRLITSYPGPT